MSNSLSDYSIKTMPNKQDSGDASHVSTIGCRVAITMDGLLEHNAYNRNRNIGIGASLGVIAWPLLVGGGIGVAVAGTALGVAEITLSVAGGVAGGYLGNSIAKDAYGHSVDISKLKLVNMVGRVISITERWFGADGHDVKVRWTGRDEYGNIKHYTSTHSPGSLVAVVLS
jgi:uncharacterized protein YcfJ